MANWSESIKSMTPDKAKAAMRISNLDTIAEDWIILRLRDYERMAEALERIKQVAIDDGAAEPKALPVAAWDKVLALASAGLGMDNG